jgi:hypothetical protein
MATQTELPQERLRTPGKLEILDETPDFSLVLGGPIFQLFRRSHLTGDALELLHRRLLVIVLIAWGPLLLLSTLSPAAGSLGPFTFLRDIEVHVRFLVALPVLIGAELIVHSRTRNAVRAFIERRIVSPEDLPRFRSALASAIKLRNSIPLEVGLILVVYTAGLWVWRGRPALTSPTWYAMPGGRWHLTPGGFWYVFVSIPLFQFILLRWYMRLFVWFRFLWHVSRMNLHLVPTHPDRCAGLGFLGQSAYAFGPVLFAQGAMLAGPLADRILYRGGNLISFKFQIAAFVLVVVTITLMPLLMFTPRLAQVKRKGLSEYGLLSQRYVDRFERKWITGDGSGPDELLGTGDIQSLADLANSYEVIRQMRAVPFGLNDVSRLVAATAAPLVPLLLTIFSPDELLMRVIKIVF